MILADYIIDCCLPVLRSAAVLTVTTPDRQIDRQTYWESRLLDSILWDQGRRRSSDISREFDFLMIEINECDGFTEPLHSAVRAMTQLRRLEVAGGNIRSQNL